MRIWVILELQLIKLELEIVHPALVELLVILQEVDMVLLLLEKLLGRFIIPLAQPEQIVQFKHLVLLFLQLGFELHDLLQLIKPGHA